VVLDPGTAAGRSALSALVAAADIVIEASRPRALAGFGLDADAAVSAGTTWVSITADGRRSARIGFGDDIAASAGLVAWTTEATPVFVGDALADPLAGLTAAALAMSAPPDGSGVLWDVAMADVVAATLHGETGTHSVPAIRDGITWVLDGPEGTLPVAPPRRRDPPPGEVAPPGAHTAEVLRELGIPVP
jgi:crotonobetainyl-CoA:carnitine CoA-transferase CaiB-like acyl-CoA transferase